MWYLILACTPTNLEVDPCTISAEPLSADEQVDGSDGSSIQAQLDAHSVGTLSWTTIVDGAEWPATEPFTLTASVGGTYRYLSSSEDGKRCDNVEHAAALVDMSLGFGNSTGQGGAFVVHDESLNFGWEPPSSVSVAPIALTLDAEARSSLEAALMAHEEYGALSTSDLRLEVQGSIASPVVLVLADITSETGTTTDQQLAYGEVSW